MSTLPIRDALVKAHLTPAHIVKEMNSGLREAAGTIYSGVRDKYVATIEKIPAEKFAKEVDKTFRDKLLTTLKNYDFTKASDRRGFCNYVYQIDLAGKGMKVF